MFYILIVLYKKSLKESQTLQGLINALPVINSANSTVHVWDNSPVEALSPADKNELLKIHTFKYTFCPNNKPLSFIYNSAINFLAENETIKYLVLLDHDSAISSDYFNELKIIADNSNQPDVVLPQAIFNNIIISPAKLFLVKGVYFKKIMPGIYTKKLLAVNSGMAISKKFLIKTGFKYSEKLLSYGTDNYFMNFSNKQRAVFYIMNFKFNHGYSFYELTDVNKKAEIFQQIKQANKLAFSSNIFEATLISIYNLMASVKNAIKNKSLSFLKFSKS